MDEIEVKISQKINEKGKFSLKLDYSSELVKLYGKIKTIYKERLEEYENYKKTLDKYDKDEFFDRYAPFSFDDPFIDLLTGVQGKNIEKAFQDVIFIPANRLLIAALQKNIFPLPAKEIEIDPFLKNFSSYYNDIRQYYKYITNSKFIRLTGSTLKIKNFMETILSGIYKYENKQDWITFGDNKIRLTNASSGQQESLPMLIILLFSSDSPERITTTFIEEPEAHLFPVSQKHIMSLIALIYNRKSHHFVLTTHSPYILVALNNMILAQDISVNGNETEVNKIINKDFHIKFEDVSAYTINNGVVETILDNDSRLIGTNIIDSVSDEFNDIFDSLLQLQRERS
jgi:hypothetical protein